VPGTNTNSITEQLVFTATDPSGFSGAASASFTVLPNHPPVVGPIPDQSVGSPGLFTPLNLDDYVADPDDAPDQMTWTVTGNAMLTVALSNRVVFISYPLNISTSITEQLTFTATDRVGWSASATARFSVAPNRPPVVSAIPAQTVTAPYAFAPIFLDNFVADPDDSDSRMTWTVTGNSRLTVSISNRVATLAYSGGATSAITESLTFTARDPVGSSAFTTTTFTVVPNRSPVVSVIPGQTVTAPNPFTLISLDAYVADPDEPDNQITWTITGISRLTVNIADRVVTISYSGAVTNSYTEQLTFTATDPHGLSGSVSAAFTVGPNRPPVVSPIPAQTNSFPYLFAPVVLDNFVADPEEPDNRITWAVTGSSRFIVTLSNRVAYVAYPTPVTSNIVEQLTFTATDPVGLTGSATTFFVIRPNTPPVVSPIPGQTNEVPVPFPSIALDNYVADPDEADSQLIWTVTGNTRFTVNLVNRVATLTYPADTTNSFSELLTFTATDPQGNSGSTAARFAVNYSVPDYVIARGASVTNNHTFSTSPANYNIYDAVTTTLFDLPPWLTYDNLAVIDVPPASVRIQSRIAAAANAPASTVVIRIEHGLEDDVGNVLTPLTNHIYNLRIKVTP
jgi:hypothetical protein